MDSCIDYQTYVAPLNTAMVPVAHIALTERLKGLGVADDERMGTTYVRGPWGFLVIPSLGFPEIRISFYHETSMHETNDLLLAIMEAIDECQAASWLTGDEYE